MNTTVFPRTDLKTLIVVGNGMVGHHCVEQLIEGGALEHYRIHVFGEESQRAYDRVHLSEYFTGRDAESLAMSEMALYEQAGLTLHLGVPVLEIDRGRHEIITAEGCFCYDKLILATGSYPFVPPIEGAQGIPGWSTAPSKTWTPFVTPPLKQNAAWWLVVACWGWRRPMR